LEAGRVAGRVHYPERYLAAALLLAALVIIALALLFPQEFGHDVLYRYFWGPIVSDAEGRTVDGIREGYTVVNTLAYAILLGAGLVALLLLLRRWGYRMDKMLVFATLPFLLLGGALRVLEDAALFNGALRYLFITPPIYLFVAGVFVLALLAGKFARTRGLLAPAAAVGTLLAVYYAAVLVPGGMSFSLSLAQPVVLAALSLLLAQMLMRRIPNDLAAVAGIGFFLLVLSAAYLASFASSPEWLAASEAVSGRPPVPAYGELLIIPGIAALLTIAVAALGRLPRFTLLAGPVELLMYFSHFLDGAATARGLEIYGYAEKHALPALLIDSFSPLIMLPLKFIIVTLVIVLLDVVLKDELSSRPQLALGLKYAVVVLGLAPGVRDMLRIALGV